MVFKAEVHGDLNPKVGIWLVWREKGDFHTIYSEVFSQLIF